jgi:hypothetical protein
MAEPLNSPDLWQFELAAMLSQIGCVAIPPDLLDKYQAGQPLEDAEKNVLASRGKIGHDLLVRIPRLEAVAQMVEHQETAGLQAKLSDSVRTGAHLLRIALDFDEQIIRGASLEQAITRLKGRIIYNQAFVAALQQVHLEEEAGEKRCVTLAQLKPGMLLNYDILSKNGLRLMGKGQELTDPTIARLRTFACTVGVREPISVVFGAAGPRTNTPAA